MSSSAGRPAWVLAGFEGFVGEQCNQTTATCLTSKGLTIEASFFFNTPPQPSKLYVHCPGAVYVEEPRLLCISGDLILFRVAINPLPGGVPPCSLRECDYFIYRAADSSPSIEPLRLPHFFQDYEVGILPRGDDKYTIAALFSVPGWSKEFKLFVYSSETRNWTSRVLLVTEPQMDFPIPIPINATYIFEHFTSKVITLGGDYGTMGWVDLWRGILFCDVLSHNPSLREVPVPLPMYHVTGNNGMGWDLGRAKDIRGIGVINGCLKFIELSLKLDISQSRRGLFSKVKDWTVSIYSNSEKSGSYSDWHKDDCCTAKASSTTVSDNLVSSPGGLLLLPSDDESEMEACLQNLVISDPFLRMDGDDLFVYMIARTKFWDPKAWLVALNVKNNTLEGVVQFAVPPRYGEAVLYCVSQ